MSFFDPLRSIRSDEVSEGRSLSRCYETAALIFLLLNGSLDSFSFLDAEMEFYER